MNIPRLKRLADRLDMTPQEKFDMGSWCGTACCIGGHARKMARVAHHDLPWWRTRAWAGSYLDLDEDTARELMDPYPRPNATPKQAAKVIRRLIRIGRVSWLGVSRTG